jgi:hypothetical protein
MRSKHFWGIRKLQENNSIAVLTLLEECFFFSTAIVLLWEIFCFDNLVIMVHFVDKMAIELFRAGFPKPFL